MEFKALTKEQCELVRQWRNEDISVYRTPFLITKEMQEDFYRDIISDRRSPHRYWAIVEEKESYGPVTNYNFIGMVGLTDISLENRNAEISIVIDPNQQQEGYGKEAIDILLDKGFYELNLNSVFAECYEYNLAIKFWNKIADKHKAEKVKLPMRKFYRGLYYASWFYIFKR